MSAAKKTQVLPPVIPQTLNDADINAFYSADGEVYDARVTGEIGGVKFYGNRNVDTSVFEGVRLRGSTVIGYNFTDVRFTGCDFSNTFFLDCSFHRTVFENCKLTGVTFEKAIFVDVSIDNCKGELTAFIDTKLKNVIVSTCALIGLNLYTCTQQRLILEENKLERLEVYQTSLKAVDLSRSDITGCVIPLESLKGAQISYEQAALVAVMSGIKVV